MKKLFTISALLLLAACGPNKDERRAQFMHDCVPAFTAQQCVVLLSIKEDAHDTKESAALSTGLAGAAIGMNAGRR